MMVMTVVHKCNEKICTLKISLQNIPDDWNVEVDNDSFKYGEMVVLLSETLRLFSVSKNTISAGNAAYR
jgi:hypothetical protein